MLSCQIVTQQAAKCLQKSLAQTWLSHSIAATWFFEFGIPTVLQGPGAKMLGNVDLSWLAGLVVAGGLYAILSSRRRQSPSEGFERQPEVAAKD